MSIQTHVKKPEATSAPTDQRSATQTETIGNQSMESIMSGRAESMGRRLDLPDAIRSKMETSFGADFSTVQLYESQAVADAGAKAVTTGGKIGFAPGKMDLSSVSGQALLGHELSHVVSQARGQVSGSGFLGDSGLEARADHEGIMAATGESVYSGAVAPLSASCVSTTTGPLQAKLTSKEKAKKKADEASEKLAIAPLSDDALDERKALPDITSEKSEEELRQLLIETDAENNHKDDKYEDEESKLARKHRGVIDNLNNDFSGYNSMPQKAKSQFYKENRWAVENASKYKGATARRNFHRGEEGFGIHRPFSGDHTSGNPLIKAEKRKFLNETRSGNTTWKDRLRWRSGNNQVDDDDDDDDD